jgi:hypothetical protein
VIKLMLGDENATDANTKTQVRVKDGYKLPFWSGFAPDTECSETGAREGKTPCYMRLLTSAPASGSW